MIFRTNTVEWRKQGRVKQLRQKTHMTDQNYKEIQKKKKGEHSDTWKKESKIKV